LNAPIDQLELPWTVQARTSDTSSTLRTRQGKKLPTALVTTPESLTLLLARDHAQDGFEHLQAVIVDEWHELLGTKRGVQVELALARLRRFRPNLRTWGISATLGNLPEAARALCGPTVSPRLVHGETPKSIRIDTTFPGEDGRLPWAGHLGLALVPQVLQAIAESQSTLIFTNTRAQTEIWYQALLAAQPDFAGVIALHHSSLDRRVRTFVEQGLKEGTLRAVVCTSSLDLGVDFAPVDRVLQVGSPKGVARLLQRAGRSGHRPGIESRVTCVPTNVLEFVEIAAARDAALAGQIESRPALSKPLDVLIQHAVTCALGGGFDDQELFEEVRTTLAYQHLTPEEWGWVLDFVVRGGESLRAYPDYARVRMGEDGIFRVESPLMARRHRMSIGTIVGEGSLQVRLQRGGVLGSVEESFIARLKPGDVFQFAGRFLKLVRVQEMTAWVRIAKATTGSVPRWMGSRMPLSGELSSAVRTKLSEARRGVYTGPEMQAVRPILELQRRRSQIPDHSELLIEQLRSREGHHLFFFPFEGRAVHEGLASLLAHRIAQRRPITFTMAFNDYGFELLSAQPVNLDAALAEGLLGTDSLEADILASLNSTELARRAFREIARIAGLVFPGMPGQGKTAKQLQASSNLFFQVFSEYDPENLLLTQARREVLDRQLELSRLQSALRRMQQAEHLRMIPERPTPMAFPLLVDRLRQSLSSEKLADRVARMQAEFEREMRG
jgi:ATP-dependent Lhr-like helicase